MAGIILLAFILVPIAEIAVFIEAGKWIGLWPTLGVIVLTALIGAAMLRQQGLRVLAQTQERLARGEMPVGELFSGLCLLVAGALLLTPGFLTDAVGFALLIPPLRDALGTFVLRRLVRNPQNRAWVNGAEIDLGGGTGGDVRRPPDNTVIEGDYTDVTDGAAPPGDDSPWRRK